MRFTYTHPAGFSESRSSKRPYTHVVLVKPKTAGAFAVWAWSTSAENAEKRARTYRNMGHEARVESVD